MNNSIYQALNSQVFQISEFMNSSLVDNMTDEKFESAYISNQKYFTPISVLNG